MAVYLDTHVVAWLYAGRLDLIPAAARRRIDSAELRISPMVALELDYLFESAKVEVAAEPVLTALARDLGLRQCDLPFARVVAAAGELTWTRDPFDRLIAAQAATAGAVLVTRDRALRRHYPAALWEG